MVKLDNIYYNKATIKLLQILFCQYLRRCKWTSLDQQVVYPSSDVYSGDTIWITIKNKETFPRLNDSFLVFVYKYIATSMETTFYKSFPIHKPITV